MATARSRSAESSSSIGAGSQPFTIVRMRPRNSSLLVTPPLNSTRLGCLPFKKAARCRVMPASCA